MLKDWTVPSCSQFAPQMPKICLTISLKMFLQICTEVSFFLFFWIKIFLKNSVLNWNQHMYYRDKGKNIRFKAWVASKTVYQCLFIQLYQTYKRMSITWKISSLDCFYFTHFAAQQKWVTRAWITVDITLPSSVFSIFLFNNRWPAWITLATNHRQSKLLQH